MDGNWRTPEELVEIGFDRCRVVMLNEAHNGLLRCARTRVIGRRILPTAHRLGVRHLAMEALSPAEAERANLSRRAPAERGYLGQPEMGAFVQAALDLGWTLIAYEADWRQRPTGASSPEMTNWREEQQARHLVAALADLDGGQPLLVWCGNGHLSKVVRRADIMVEADGRQVALPTGAPPWTPMGYLFTQLSTQDCFSLDQVVTVDLHPGFQEPLAADMVAALERLGGTAGFLAEEVPAGLRDGYADRGMDAYLLSTDNAMT